MIEKFKKLLDEGGEYATLLTELSKTFNCLQHDLIRKLHAHGFDKAPLRLMHSCPTDRYERVKINNCYNLWRLNEYGVPQFCPNLGPRIFNIFLCDMFFMIDTTDIDSYVDHNTPYSVGKNQS